MEKWRLVMKFLKYISLCVLLLGSASCWGMKRVTLTQPLTFSFEDLTIEHKKENLDFGDDINESIDLKLKKGNMERSIGYIECSVLDIQKPKHIIKKFADRYLGCHNFKNKIKEVCCLCKNCKKIIIIDHIKINDAYQQQGLGRSFLKYFLTYVARAYPESVVFIRPIQSFAKKGNLSKDELHKKIVDFYKSFEAKHMICSPEWMFIL